MGDLERQAARVEAWLTGARPGWMVAEIQRLISVEPFDPHRVTDELQQLGVDMESMEFIEGRVKFLLRAEHDSGEMMTVTVDAVIVGDRLEVHGMSTEREGHRSSWVTVVY